MCTPLWAVAEGWVVTVSCVAAPAVIVMAVDVTLVRPVAEKLNVRSPAVPLKDGRAKGRETVEISVAGGSLTKNPPPVAIAAVTVTPPRLTGIPPPQRTWT